MKKSVLLGAGILATTLLVGCGGSSSSGGTSVSEYDLGAYEGRNVAKSSLAGTWVLAGKGFYSYKDAVDTQSANYAVKEYFVITGDSALNYKKSSCDNEGVLDEITVDGSQMKVNDFTGTITENSRVVGVVSTSTNNDSYTQNETINVTLIKISDSITPFASLSATTPNGALANYPISCFNQINGGFNYNNYSTTFEEFTFFDGSTIEKYNGSEGFTALSHYINGNKTVFDTDFVGDSVTYTHTISSSQLETLTFNASDNSDSIQGTLTVTVP